MSVWVYVLVLFTMAFATEALVELIVKSKFFEGFRNLVSKLSWFKQLFSCGYCVSVWVAMGLVAAIPVVIVPLSDWPFVNILITLLIVHRTSNVIHNVIDKWTDKYYDARFMNTEKD